MAFAARCCHRSAWTAACRSLRPTEAGNLTSRVYDLRLRTASTGVVAVGTEVPVALVRTRRRSSSLLEPVRAEALSVARCSGPKPFAVQSRSEPRSLACRDARDRSLLRVQCHSKPKLQVVQSAGAETLAVQTHFEPKLSVVRKCVEPKLFAGEKVLGAEALCVQSGLEPKPLALQTWEEPKQAPAQPILRCLSVRSSAGRSLWSILSLRPGPARYFDEQARLGSDLIRPTWRRSTKYR